MENSTLIIIDTIIIILILFYIKFHVKKIKREFQNTIDLVHENHNLKIDIEIKKLELDIEERKLTYKKPSDFNDRQFLNWVEFHILFKSKKQHAIIEFNQRQINSLKGLKTSKFK